VTNLAELGCDKQYREDFVETGEVCGPPGMEGEIVHVGFTVNSTFFWQFTSCHQASRAHNLWVSHTVAGAIPARDQNNDRKLSFINLCSIKISKTPKLSSSKAIGIYNISHFNNLC